MTKKIHITENLLDKLVYMGVKMVLDGTPVGMAVAVLSQTNNLDVASAVSLKTRIVETLR